MKILFIGKTMNYYIGDGINIRKSDNTTGKVEIDVPDWKGNQLMADFPDDFIPVAEKQTEKYVEFKSELSPAPEDNPNHRLSLNLSLSPSARKAVRNEAGGISRKRKLITFTRYRV